MKRILIFIMAGLFFIGCSTGDKMSWKQLPLPPGMIDAHILSIDIKGNEILLGTYGLGAFFSADAGKNWGVIDTTKGLSWNFVLGADWENDYMILATLGDGVNISRDAGKTWKRYGFDFFGIEYLYTAGVKIHGSLKYLPTADGLVIFDNIDNWHSCTEKEGLSSQYVYDMQIVGDTIILGTLHGISISNDLGISWKSSSPNNKFTAENAPDCKVRSVAITGDIIYAGCDDGLYSSGDLGISWEKITNAKFAQSYIHDLMPGKSGELWAAGYYGIGRYNLKSKVWQVYDETSGLPGNNVNCLGRNSNGEIFAGTNYGIFVLSNGDVSRKQLPAPHSEYMIAEAPLHQWMQRPVAPQEQNCRDQTYLYGSTMGGNFRQHQGNEYNAPEGTPLLAVDDGVFVYADPEIGHSVLKCDRKQGDFIVYAHYHHQDKILRKVGEHVARGEQVGTIGKKGNVTNEHLHFEVSLSAVDDSNKVSHTRNSELWIEPLPGCGTIVGQLLDADNIPIAGARIYGVTKPIPTETPFSFAETYMDKVNPDEWYHENFAIGDVPEGEYVLRAGHKGEEVLSRVKVAAGKITKVMMKFE